MPITRAIAVAALTAASVALGGCGKKGPLEYPEGKQYDTVVKADGSTEKKPRKPTRPFVLDGLLN